MPTTLWPPETINARPCAMPSVPSVATNGGTPSATTSAPFERPNDRPTPTAAASATARRCSFISSVAMTTPARLSTAPMERSRPSVMMTSVIGSASSSRTDDCTPMFSRFAAVANPEPNTANTTASSASTYAAPLFMVHGELQDVGFAQIAALQFSDDPLVAHHIGAVAHGHHLRQFGADHQDARAVGDQPADDAVDLRLGTDVDAARGFVEDEKARSGGEPLADDDFLLIPAAQQPHRPRGGRRGNPQTRHDVARNRRRGASAVPPARKPLAKAGDEHVVFDRPHQRQPFRLPVLGDQSGAGADGTNGSAVNRLPAEAYRSAAHTIGAEDRARELAPSSTDETRQAHNFPAADRERGPLNAV